MEHGKKGVRKLRSWLGCVDQSRMLAGSQALAAPLRYPEITRHLESTGYFRVKSTTNRLRRTVFAFLCFTLSACNGGSSTAPISTETQHQPFSIANTRQVERLRGMLSLPPAEIRWQVRATLPVGTRIYRLPSFDVRDGTTTYNLIGPVQKFRSGSGYELVDQYGNRVRVSGAATITDNPWGVEYYIRPGMPLPKSLVGVTPTEVISGAARHGELRSSYFPPSRNSSTRRLSAFPAEVVFGATGRE